jgi:hypothetical protein
VIEQQPPPTAPPTQPPNMADLTMPPNPGGLNSGATGSPRVDPRAGTPGYY